MEKEEIARNKQISSFPTMISTQSDNHVPICPYFWHHIFTLFTAELEEPKIGIWGEGFTEKAPSMTMVTFVAYEDQDQAAQNVYPDLIYTHFFGETLRMLF